MDNQQKITELFKTFELSDTEKAKKICDSINNNFEIESDEFTFSIDCKIHKPHEKLATELELKGTPELIAEKESDRELIKNTIAIQCRIHAIDLHCESKISRVASFNLTKNGIGGVVAGAAVRKDDAREIIECWLVREFGSVMHW